MGLIIILQDFITVHQNNGFWAKSKSGNMFLRFSTSKAFRVLTERERSTSKAFRVLTERERDTHTLDSEPGTQKTGRRTDPDRPWNEYEGTIHHG